MTAQEIKAGEEHLYVMFVVVDSVGGWFWHDMEWSSENGGFWEPNCYRSICSFSSKEEAIRNMRFEVPHIMDSDEWEKVPSKDGELLFRRKEDSDSIPF